MKSATELTLLTDFRRELMGVAILWIILFHSNLNAFDLGRPLVYLKNIGYLGVDVFFMLSGFGLAYSAKNNPDSIMNFYFRRFRRVVPAYWIFLVLGSLLGLWVGGSLQFADLPARLVGLDFLGDVRSVYWYVPALMIFYLIFPLLNALIKRGKSLAFFIFCAACWMVVWILGDGSYSYLIIAIVRLPVFALGVWLLYYLSERKISVPAAPFLIHLAISLAGLVVLLLILSKVSEVYKQGYGLIWAPSLVFVASLSVSIASIFGALGKINKITRGFFSFLGDHSFELYLIHVWIFSLPVFDGGSLISGYFGAIPTFCLAALLSLCVARYFKYGVDRLLVGFGW
jgi:peptidoglycan/LPS O-acetylase OafA/YrhL